MSDNIPDTNPTKVGPPEHPTSPASARSANRDVPPLRSAMDALLKLPGHMGCDTVTVKNLTVMRVDEEQNLILVKGAIPGGKNGIVRVRMA